MTLHLLPLDAPPASAPPVPLPRHPTVGSPDRRRVRHPLPGRQPPADALRCRSRASAATTWPRRLPEATHGAGCPRRFRPAPRQRSSVPGATAPNDALFTAPARGAKPAPAWAAGHPRGASF